MKKLLQPFLFSTFLLAIFSCNGQEFGKASFYANSLDGRITAYGDVYDKDKLSAASNTHPYGTMLKVTRLDNDLSVIVEVIDKGPYAGGRIIDLSYAAARKLKMLDEGVVEVKVEVHKRSNKRTPGEIGQATETAPSPGAAPKPVIAGEPNANNTDAKVAGPVNASPRLTSFSPGPSGEQEDSKYGLYRIRLDKAPATGFGVQVSVITDYAMVMKRVSELQAKHFNDGILLSVEPGQEKPMYKLMLGPFETRSQAETYQANLKTKYDITGFVVDFKEKNYNPPPTSGNGG